MNISTSKKNADHIDYYEWAVQLNRLSLDAVGLWPADYRGRKKFFSTMRAVLSFTLILISCTIPCLRSLFMNSKEKILFVNNISCFIPLMIIQLKFLIIYKQKKILLFVVNAMAEDWAKPKTVAEQAIMIRQARVGRTVGVFLYTLLIVLTALMFILPRFGIMMRYVTNDTDTRRAFPIPVYFEESLYQSPYYEILLIMQFIVVLICVVTYTGIDNFLATLIFHVCGQLENLRARIANMKESEYFDRVLTSIVSEHMRLIRAVAVIEDSFTLMLLVLFLNFVTFTCTHGLLILSMLTDKSHNNTLQIVYTVGLVINTFFQTYLYCFAGQLLTTQSEGLYDAVYECDWLSLKSKEAKNLILIMARTMTPLYITAGKLFPMTMLTFCNILKMSLSYVSFFMTKL